MKSLFAIVVWTVLLPSVLGCRGTPASSADFVTKDEKTAGALNSYLYRIQDYATEHNHLPEHLSDIAQEGPPPLDGWGNPLTFAPQADGTVVLEGLDSMRNVIAIRFAIIDNRNLSDWKALFLTFARMGYSFEAGSLSKLVCDYAKEHGRLPESLANLHLEPNTIDGWGQPFTYTARPDGAVVLASGGKKGSGQIFSVQFMPRENER